ncbi:glycosyltransferase family 2 protein [Alkalihalobacterium elongatum]|uniref:glycosyltransferase family 2 protein n=1 Tax=Alkalihalobacterium elongatum TaxID=2675466 RepID=UPI001C1F65DE|nr:glycosyltransferase [Alkalihalobacterium elongatum]
MGTKITVIIPVYNAEKYLSQCIQSLLNQSLQDCEFIFINDGSTDNSQKLIEEFKATDQRIKLINQENLGVSIARNIGLELATGEYVGFVDADDYIESDMYEQLYKATKNGECDVIITDFESEIDGQKVITTYPFPVNQTLNRTFIEGELLPHFVKSENLNSACNKIYSNKRIIENKIRFPEKLALGEDGMFNMLFFNVARNMKYINYTGYHYREVKGSATRNLVRYDYFSRALEVYTKDLPSFLIATIGREKVQQLKAIKFIHSVLSYIYIYFTANDNLRFKERFNYVKVMIHHPKVKEALPIYYNEYLSGLGRYERFLLEMIKRKATFALYCATTYSKLRNRRFGGS